MRPLLVIALAIFGPLQAAAATEAANDEISAAVAANFRDAFTALARGFETADGARIRTTFGASGLLYAQIVQGAPYDLFFSADRDRPEALVAEHGAAAATLRVYAIGRLALWSPGRDVDTLRLDASMRVALANPRLAPYGRAAASYLERTAGTPRRVLGNNVAQTFHFTASGAVDAGFVALAQLVAAGTDPHTYRVVPADMHPSIEQAVVAPRPPSPAARRFLDYLESDGARRIIGRYGYR